MKIYIITLLTMISVLTGCKTIEITPESAYKTGSSVGLATGYFVKMSKIDDTAKSVLTSITDELAYVVPTNSQSFANLWLPLVKTKINFYAEQKKLTPDQIILINKSFIIITEALDHLLNKNEQLKNSTDSILSAVNGFCTAFNSVMTIDKVLSSRITYDVDYETYMYLSIKFEN